MRIDSSAAVSGTLPENRAVAGQQLQVLFSEVLEQVGRSGYASAGAYQTPNPIEHDIRQGWSDWFAAATQDGAYATGPAAVEERYGEILIRSWREGGYHDPRGFLQQLGQHELDVVQQVHRLAQPIAVGSLSEEGALNLLIPPPAQVDADHDGLTQVGAGSTIRFPNSDTPAHVVAAWDDATAGMDLQEKMGYELRMMLPAMLAKLSPQELGLDLGSDAPRSPDVANPMTQPGYSYLEITQRSLDALQRFKRRMSPEQYVRETRFWSEFQDRLRYRAHEAAPVHGAR